MKTIPLSSLGFFLGPKVANQLQEPVENASQEFEAARGKAIIEARGER
jgi:hypothetical protein